MEQSGPEGKTSGFRALGGNLTCCLGWSSPPNVRIISQDSRDQRQVWGPAEQEKKVCLNRTLSN